MMQLTITNYSFLGAIFLVCEIAPNFTNTIFNNVVFGLIALFCIVLKTGERDENGSVNIKPIVFIGIDLALASILHAIAITYL